MFCFTSYCRYLVACIWPKPDHAWETVTTLRFATRMRCIESSEPVKNTLSTASAADALLCRQLRRDIHLLRRELALRDMISGSLSRESWSVEPTARQQAETQAMVAKYVLQTDNSEDDKIFESMHSFSQIRYFIETMRSMLLNTCNNDQMKLKEVLRPVLGKATVEVPEEEQGQQIKDNNNNNSNTRLSNAEKAGYSTSYEIENTGMEGERNQRVQNVVGTPVEMPSNGSTEAISVEDDIPIQNRFEAFKLGPGAELHAAYEVSLCYLLFVVSVTIMTLMKLNALHTEPVFAASYEYPSLYE